MDGSTESIEEMDNEVEEEVVNLSGATEDKITPDDCISRVWNVKENRQLDIAIDTEEAANYVLENIKVVTLWELDKVLTYSNGVYIMSGTTSIDSLLEVAFGKYKSDKSQLNLLTNHVVKEVIGKIKRKTFTSLDKFDADPNTLNMANGLYHIDSDTFEPHRPDYYSMIQTPVNYDPQATCPEIEKAVNLIFLPRDREKIYEYTGYGLYRDYSIQNFFILVGVGETGKSRWFDIIRHFYGEKNCANVTLESISQDVFATSDFQNKLANIAGDLDIGTISKTGVLKQITGGVDVTRAQRKHEQSFDFKSFAKIWFGTNGLSRVLETTSGFFRRPIIIRTLHTFTPTDENIQMFKNTITPSELSGLFNKVIPKLRNLLNNHKFTDQMSLEDTEFTYTALSDPTGAFIEECIEESAENEIIKTDLMVRYHEFCERIGPTAKPIGINPLSKRIHAAFPEGVVRSGQTTVQGKGRVPCLHGVRLRKKT